MVVILVRHAERQASGADPSLTAAGKRRASLLATMFAGSGVTAIFTSDAARTKETAAPLAAKLGADPAPDRRQHGRGQGTDPGGWRVRGGRRPQQHGPRVHRSARRARRCRDRRPRVRPHVRADREAAGGRIAAPVPLRQRLSVAAPYASTDVQAAQRRAAIGTSLRHSWHFFVVGSGGASPRLIRAMNAFTGTTTKK